METLEDLELRSWWGYLGEDIQKLLLTSEFIYNAVESWGAELPGGKEKFHDYSFVLFPAAKAYEGFLKKIFLEMGFITEEDYYGKHFRIGKALNPSLTNELGEQSVYVKIIKHCKGRPLADHLWETWRLCRNVPFHWFPNEKNAITLPEARERIEMIVNAIDEAYRGCKV
ncbi:hypothetical protein A2434_02100 [Candidatus Woesebacteria bacterium RIFOXYC1_FULL_41_14]|uniref:Bacterial toxin RNase RnlA/LsoA DBD domain-containing protein n=2 Tax=Candidatus Woeseibacteriota TaxID=1752722 RepID=A0A1F8DF28_9BACT|nr:MAG: hypothetical protein A2393_02615 [Candidatus Woesebacteria bacterium RIFOXYB1_FULL_41_13]OGM84999.1 MAG: hypothetical protein A2434_02100 [Candidatus Woesebacteria bacterium RIFOXYC1_FULL_41_14]OGM87200.1 MAG: hypothetical protein A2594_02460 [Candidatus Woesebacteria bacterium RIFOXYD1_FULL_41_28]